MKYLMGQGIPSMWYLVMLSVCIGQGDGRWKGQDKENLHHDIAAYRQMTEKLEREMEAYYDEYPNGWLRGDNVDRIRNTYLTNILNRNAEITKNSENKDGRKHTFPIAAREKYKTETIEPKTDASKGLAQIAQNKFKTSEWPTFQDILLAIGRKYDWKNDRWIKVRQKLKTKTNIGISHSDGEKHKFSYSIVKLSKSKNKRNVVVAVSAVR